MFRVKNNKDQETNIEIDYTSTPKPKASTKKKEKSHNKAKIKNSLLSFDTEEFISSLNEREISRDPSIKSRAGKTSQEFFSFESLKTSKNSTESPVDSLYLYSKTLLEDKIKSYGLGLKRDSDKGMITVSKKNYFPGDIVLKDESDFVALHKNCLMDHFSKFSTDHIIKLSNLARLAIQTNEKEKFTDISNKSIVHLFTKLEINSFSLLDSECNNLGIGLYTSGFIFNHSCRPNCVSFFNGKKMIVRAVSPISINEELTISYLDQTLSYQSRQSKLLKEHFFKCNCQICCLQNSSLLSSKESFGGEHNSKPDFDDTARNENMINNKIAPSNFSNSDPVFTIKDFNSQDLHILTLRMEFITYFDDPKMSNVSPTPLQNSEDDSFSDNNNLLKELDSFSDYYDNNDSAEKSSDSQKHHEIQQIGHLFTVNGEEFQIDKFIEKFKVCRKSIQSTKSSIEDQSILTRLQDLISTLISNFIPENNFEIASDNIIRCLLILHYDLLDASIRLNDTGTCVKSIDFIVSALERQTFYGCYNCVHPRITIYKVMRLKKLVNDFSMQDPGTKLNQYMSILKELFSESDIANNQANRFFSNDESLILEIANIKESLQILRMNIELFLNKYH
ncbi:Histone-lysine N-methyltransferase SMYD3 [Smittium mucronatum]|uniref:Histone-lysine N-methyltransferase SMYD3 n=1 Tax=Smittium mucronatum TaxID=133383 RepID=A0A1R0GM40_9FUNG|nr:Histone-lysine N-methyltransferase SMYD3 [Smittium mucronatum]